MGLTNFFQIRNAPTKLPVKAVTTVPLPANTYANGTAGAGATLTASANGALVAIDGVTLVNSDRLLVKNEATPANNGIYIVTQIGTGGTPYILTRTDDCNTNARIFAGIFVHSTSDGTLNGNSGFQLTTITNPIIVGTTALTWGIGADIEPAPIKADKGIPSAVTAGNFSSTAVAITNTPYNGSYVAVFVNGAQQVLGDGVKTKDCYFSADGGVTARTIANIVATDVLYWNGLIALFNLTALDFIDLDYTV